MKKYLTIAACSFLVTACKKSNLQAYEQPDRVYIYQDPNNASRDSIAYSFATRQVGLQTDTVKIPLRIMGVARSRDRVVNVEVIRDSSTAVENQHFTLLPTVIKANEYTGHIPVVVKRTADMKTGDKRLMVQITQSADFEPGVPSTIVQSPRAGGTLRMVVKINDFLTKPANWDTQLGFYFGTYSQVKYAFVISVTGRSEFVPGSGVDNVSSSQLAYYKVLCKDALAAYNASHPPLTDEFGLAVTFPN